jgi:glutamate synthase domain-containing protein 2
LGKRREFIAIGKAMVATKIVPDFIVIDGGEGGTGAAPLEFSNHVGTPLKDALVFIHNCLVGFDLRKEIKILVAGKVVTGFDIVDKMALGADICNSARGMMLALGCIQALRCHSNTCPTGVATQNPELERGLVVRDKAQRVFQYHKNTVKSLAELVGAMGLSHTSQIKPWHILTRVSRTETKHYGELYPFLEPGAFLAKTIHPSFARAFNAARPDSWASSQDLMLAEVGAG